MATKFNLEHFFPGVSIADFESHLNHPKLLEMLAEMPAFRARDLLDKTEGDDGKITWRFKVVAGGEIPPAAQKVLSEDMLTWVETSTFDPSTHSISWSIEPMVMKDKFSGFGTWKLHDENGGTRRVIEGTIEIKFRFVGKIAESFIIAELKKNYAVEPQIHQNFFDAMKNEG
ncbi:MAG: hypothetical protein CMH56_09580 [Myxococcales bacterium]|nr:hypothetical protein [Myxococcales bacterium]|tara:strand:+ start:231 stop:746 length:516 start_codon:yes stop_codon:yes gene_type:complete